MSTNRFRRDGFRLVVGLVAVFSASMVSAQPCVVSDNGNGTVNLPPVGGTCGYLSPQDVHEIVNGLPPGTTIILGAAHSRFGNIIVTPGGPLGGEREQFGSEVFLELHGTGQLAGYNRMVNMAGVNVVTDTAPRGTGTPQIFATDMFGMQGQLPPGDPDFDLLRITAGTNFGMPSPGQTTLTRLGPPGSNWQVDSFFDISYRIDFIGKPGGPLGGHSGSTTGTIRMQTGAGSADGFGCCLPMGMCVTTSSVAACLAQGGSPLPAGTGCAGDQNGDGIDEACFSPPCVECGPGPHWIDVPGCPPDGSGQDTIPSGAYLGIDTNFDCIADTNVVAFGPVTISKRGPQDDATNFPGTRPIDGHLDVIDTEILGMSLSGGGVTLRAGTFSGSNQPLQPSRGAVAEQPSNPNLADSFFDVFFEIEISPGSFAYNQTAIQVASTIDCMPPKDNYFHLGGCMPLYSSPTGGVLVGNLVQANHFTYPACCAATLPGGCAPNIPATQCPGTVVPACLGDGNANGVDDACDPQCTRDPTTLTGCSPTCPPPVGTNEQCLPRTAGCNPHQAGSCGVLECECQDPGFCHLGKNPATGAYECQGGCPAAGDTCTLLGTGAFDNPFRCDCVGTPGCVPNADASDCEQTMCPGPVPPIDTCHKKCVKIDADGNIEVTDCECEPANDCHVEVHQGPVPRGAGEEGGVAGGGNGCIVPDNGGGTVTLPPAGCDYLSPSEVHAILDGLPPNTTLELAPIHQGIFCREQNNVCSFPPGVDCSDFGGSLGGEKECASSQLQFQLTCVSTGPGGCPGALSGWSRPVTLPQVDFETHVAPRNPGDPVQSFDTQMFRLFGQITNPGSGDPDFDLLRVVAGNDFGLPSPGHTTLTQLPGGSWAVDSFFDITYRIDYVGRPGGALGGMSGSTTATIRMQTSPPVKCEGDCPAGTVCEQTNVPQSDGTNKICCDCVTPPSDCEPNAAGTDCNQVNCPGPIPPIDTCQKKCVKIDAAGVVTVTDCECEPATECHVEIHQGPVPRPGADGGVAGGGNGCIVPDNGGGTVALPPAGCDYLSPSEVHAILDGLPPNTTLELAPIHQGIFCREQNNVCSFPPGVDCSDFGGSLGGEKECASSQLQFQLSCVSTGPGGCPGALSGWSRPVMLPQVDFETHVAPRSPGDPVQSFDTQMFRLFGQITGDPDFDLLRITAGNDFGLPSPGHTTLTQMPGGSWAVDSFFDITYRIDFVGRAGGHIGGMSGSTTGTIRMQTTPPVKCEGDCPAGTVCQQSNVPQSDGTNKICCDCVTPPQVCEPNTTGTDCNPVNCPAGPVGPEICRKKCVKVDADGNPTVTDCDCQPDFECHVELGTPGTPRGVGMEMEGGVAGGPNGCVVPDNGGGTVTLPPVGCDYLTADEVHEMVNGLPPGTTLQLGAIHQDFVCNRQNPGVCSFPLGVDCDQLGGSLGGEQECANSTLALTMNGQCTGAPNPICGYSRNVNLPVTFETHTAPRTPGAMVQSFDTAMARLQGQLPPGDPDFDLFRVTAGHGFGLPSPGHTTLSKLPGGSWAVDSFFDITYRIDFIGKAGGPFSGMSGSTTATIRMQTNAGFKCRGLCPAPMTCQQTNVPQADGTHKICCDCVDEPLGACCLDDGTCVNTTQAGCNGVFVPGVTCTGTVEACCDPSGISCQMKDPACCTASGGTPMGPGSNCSGIQTGCCLPGIPPAAPTCIMADPQCCTNAGGTPQFGTQCNGGNQACCLPDGTCVETDPICCDDLGGTPGPAGSVCLGDIDGDGIDEACEQDCVPTPDGSGCTDFCPQGPVQEACHQRCAKYHPETGQITVTECDCRGQGACHLIYPGGGGGRDAGDESGIVAGGPNNCVEPDAGGTVALPPAGLDCPYVSPDNFHEIIAGLPPGTTVQVGIEHARFVNINNQPGGSLGGERETFNSMVTLTMNGQCSGPPNPICGYNRVVSMMNIPCETHIGPRTPGQASQSFDTAMFMMQGQLPPGDPDFDLLRITAGNGFGLPSPGHTTLTRLGPPGSDWAVDSFFDITYRIDFVGAAGGPFGGMSGSTTGTIRMGTKPPFKCIGGCGPRRSCTPLGQSNIDGTISVCCDCRPKKLIADTSLFNKPRFVSFSMAPAAVAGGEDEESAIRVRLVSLHHVVPPYSGGPSVPFTAFEGQVRFAGPPAEFIESTANPVAFSASQLQCDPYYHDWSTISLLHLTGSALTPSSVYDVEVLGSICAGNEEACEDVSDPLQMRTTRWGDVESPFQPPDATAQPNFVDIAALVAKFRSQPGAPIKARALLAGVDAAGTINLGPDFSFIHIAACVDAFRGKPYPHTIATCP